MPNIHTNSTFLGIFYPRLRIGGMKNLNGPLTWKVLEMTTLLKMKKLKNQRNSILVQAQAVSKTEETH